MSGRLPAEHGGTRIDRSRTLRFTFDGRVVEAHPGDTVGSALHAAGVTTLSRSFKYHRPRGLLCCAGQCPNCLVDVDGTPGARACTEPARDGMTVTPQNAWPSLGFDALRAVDRVGGPFTPPGFYYKMLIRPRAAWRMAEPMIRRIAGLGRLDPSQTEREWRTDYRRRHCDVLVVGGGVAGLTAALRAAELGADVVLTDDGPEPGGRCLAEGEADTVAELAGRARAAGVEILQGASALGFFDGLTAVWQGSVLHQIRAARTVVATGAVEQPLVFAGNDLPGVMLSGAVRRLMQLYGVAPGTRAVVAGVGDPAIEAALALRAAGIQVAAVADARHEPAGDAVDELRRAGIPLLGGHTVVRAAGRGRVAKAWLAPVGASGGRATSRLRCDLLVVSGGMAPATSLLAQAGTPLQHDGDRGRFVPADLPPGVFAAGQVLGHDDPRAAELSGALAGADAAHELGLGDDASRERLQRDVAALRSLSLGVAAAPAPAPPDGERGRCVVCLCEDVTVKDLKTAVAEGFDDIELAKRYTTATMGPCQGRMCQRAVNQVLGAETARTPAAVGLTTARPPWTTVPLGLLAGRPYQPAKRSPLHHRHKDAGARIEWAGEWRRAYDYGDVEAEVAAVHDACGVIDVSSLGKLLVRGPDAGAFLDRIYPNRMSTLAPGRVRYGVLTGEAGRIIDDGTVARLDDETFYVTTTSSGAGAIAEWLQWWQADWRLDVSITDVTQSLSAVNLAGPKARLVLGALAPGLDCSNDGFAYLDAKRGTVAGIEALALRIGFVGELGYELHVPSAHVATLWDALLETGAEHGIRPFGLEPQRILRLQKGHPIIGVDTDAETTPAMAGMDFAVKLDKEEPFVGRWALERLAGRECSERLVGVVMDGAGVPGDGAVVVAGDAPAGRVTSARHSARLDRGIGLAWVPAGLSELGSRIEIRDGGTTYAAEVVDPAFYDPDGERLRA